MDPDPQRRGGFRQAAIRLARRRGRRHEETGRHQACRKDRREAWGAAENRSLYVERGRRPFCTRLCADGPAAHRKAAFFDEVCGDYKQFGWIRTASVGAIGLYESQ